MSSGLPNACLSELLTLESLYRSSESPGMRKLEQVQGFCLGQGLFILQFAAVVIGSVSFERRQLEAIVLLFSPNETMLNRFSSTEQFN